MSPYNKLWTKTAYAKVPALYDQEKLGDKAVARVKLFCINNDMRWYVLEFDPENGRAFCLVTQNGEAELGYSAINEVNPGDWEGEDMMSLNNRSMVPPYERDSSFKEATVGEIKAKLAKGLAA